MQPHSDQYGYRLGPRLGPESSLYLDSTFDRIANAFESCGKPMARGRERVAAVSINGGPDYSSWRPTASAISSWLASQWAVEFSMSVIRNVTIPDGVLLPATGCVRA